MTDFLDHTELQDIINMKKQEAIKQALDTITSFGGIDGAHHKQWVLDQVVRALTGEKYAEWVAEYENGEDGPNTYDWNVGIMP